MAADLPMSGWRVMRPKQSARIIRVTEQQLADRGIAYQQIVWRRRFYERPCGSLLRTSVQASNAKLLPQRASACVLSRRSPVAFQPSREVLHENVVLDRRFVHGGRHWCHSGSDDYATSHGSERLRRHPGRAVITPADAGRGRDGVDPGRTRKVRIDERMAATIVLVTTPFRMTADFWRSNLRRPSCRRPTL